MIWCSSMGKSRAQFRQKAPTTSFQRNEVVSAKIYIFTDYEKLIIIRDIEPGKLLMLLIPGCLGNVCELQKLLNI